MPNATALYLPTKLDLKVYKGDDLTIPFTFTQGGNPYPVNAWTFKAQVRKKPNDAALLAEFVIDYTNAASGVVVLSLSAAAMDLLPALPLAWDMKATISAQKRTLFAGAFAVSGEVTRA